MSDCGNDAHPRIYLFAFAQISIYDKTNVSLGTIINTCLPFLISLQPEKLNVYKNDSDTSWDYTLGKKNNSKQHLRLTNLATTTIDIDTITT